MRQRPTFTNTIARQTDEFLPIFDAQVGADVAAVFANEQRQLRRAGLPSGSASVGEKLPDAALVQVGGGPIRLRALLDGAAAVIVFYRGSWCPFCTIALKTYQRELLPVVEALGTRLIAVSPHAPALTATAALTAGVQLDLYCDPGNGLARELGIAMTPSEESTQARAALGIDIAASSTDGTRTIPYPTVIVTDATGTIRFIDVKTDYITRTETCDIVDALINL